MAKYRNLRMVTIRELMVVTLLMLQVSGGVVAVTTSKGKVEEYKNGSYKRTY